MPDGASDTGDGFFPATNDDFGNGLAEDLRARVKAELEPGERLLWAVRSSPPPGYVSVGHVVVAGVSLVLIAGGLAFVVYEVARPRVPFNRESTMPLGIGLCLVGSLFFLGWIAAWVSGGHERRRQSNVCYALTDRRVIAWIPEPKGDAVRVRSLHRGQVADVVRVERPDGSGSLEFLPAKDCTHHLWYGDGIKHIPEVRRLEQIVRNHLIPNEGTA